MSSFKRTRGSGEHAFSSSSSSNGVGECPICFYQMSERGIHTVVRPFNCGGERHAICRSCDQRMFSGHDDRCPICRADRSGISICTNGARAPGIPVHQRRPDDGGFSAIAHFFAEVVDDDDADGGDGGIRYSSIIARPGTDETFDSLEEMIASTVASHGISRALTNRPRTALRSGINNERPTRESSSNSNSAVIAAVMQTIDTDPGIAAAMDGLRNPFPLGTFLDRVRGLSAGAPRQARAQGRSRASSRHRSQRSGATGGA